MKILFFFLLIFPCNIAIGNIHLEHSKADMFINLDAHSLFRFDAVTLNSKNSAQYYNVLTYYLILGSDVNRYKIKIHPQTRTKTDFKSVDGMCPFHLEC